MMQNTRSFHSPAGRLLPLLLAFLLSVALLSGCGGGEDPEKSVYADVGQWAYYETDVTGKDADVFFVAPTAYRGEDGVYQWTEYDEVVRPKFVGAITMQKGIYDARARFFSPMYHQAALNTAGMSDEERKPYYDAAYAEVREAFLYYLEHENGGRPLILAGFSQGAEMCIRLLKDVFADPILRDYLLVACYAIGWRITEEELAEYPQIRMAAEEDDTGVLVTFNSEATGVTGSPIVPEGVRTLGINPLNWKTDSTYADKSLNLGACFTDYSGAVTSEIPQLTGAYLDPVRGTLVLPDVTPEEYPGKLFPDGIYHIYDYQFFYRNIQENVSVRLDAYLSARDCPPEADTADTDRRS